MKMGLWVLVSVFVSVSIGAQEVAKKTGKADPSSISPQTAIFLNDPKMVPGAPAKKSHLQFGVSCSDKSGKESKAGEPGYENCIRDVQTKSGPSGQDAKSSVTVKVTE